MIERVRGADHDFEYEHRLQMPDHSIKYLHLIAHGIRDKDGRLEYIGAAQDVTQRRLSEEALGKARSELAHVARVTSLGVLTASIAHEVNQPLAAIITNGETGLRWLARSDLDVEKVREFIRRVVADARRASEIIDRIRAMATQASALGKHGCRSPILSRNRWSSCVMNSNRGASRFLSTLRRNFLKLSATAPSCNRSSSIWSSMQSRR